MKKARILSLALALLLALIPASTAFAINHAGPTIDCIHLHVGDTFNPKTATGYTVCTKGYIAFCLQCHEAYLYSDASACSSRSVALENMPEHAGHKTGWVYLTDIDWLHDKCDGTPFTVMYNDIAHNIQYVEATGSCTEDGVAEHYACKACGKAWLDADGAEPIFDFDQWKNGDGKIPAPGHDTELLNALDPTCEEAGYTGDLVCKTCHDVVEAGHAIDPLGHDTEVVDAVDPLCALPGYTGDTVCKRCHVTVETGHAIDPLGHDGVTYGAIEPTCEEDGFTGNVFCRVCANMVEAGRAIPALGHDTEVVDALDPLCEADGCTGDVVCKRCGKTVEEGEIIPALGHDIEVVDALEPLCTAQGYTGDTVCKRCEKVIEEGEFIPALGHEYKDGVCVRCGEKDPTFNPDTPATGDTQNLTLWAALMALAAVTAAAVICSRKRVK